MVFAVVCVVLAATGHVLMSGSPVPWWTLLGSAAGVAGVAWALGGAERGACAVVSLTVTVQAALHVCFSLTQGSGPPGAPSPGDPDALRQWARHLLCGPDPGSGAAARAYEVAAQAGLTHRMRLPSAELGHGMPGGVHGMAGMHHMGTAAGTASWGMLLAHLAAAVLCGLWLAQGERAAFRLLRTFADRAFAPLRLVLAVLRPVPSRPRPSVRRPRTRRLRSLLLVHSLPTRGPPGNAAVL
ncbi:hypothetical protein ABTZ78_13610 [Streptomyces bauhiniae]|uniref:hypothetical protein n=1 Tax=Streptomyces bauhiniae TaxID=2340725 RepID=UPI00332BB2B2